ncbi:MAG: CapA family protein, partial [Kofleriaceae bacterium]
MRGWFAVVFAIGCGQPTPLPAVHAAPVAVVAAVPAASCDPGVPQAACTAYLASAKTGALSRCDHPTGAWRYALVAPLYTPVDDLSAARLRAMWRGETRIHLAASADTIAALAPVLGDARVDLLADRHVVRWAIVPVDELSPAWKIVTVGGAHALRDDGGVLAVGLCGGAITNVDPKDVTTLAMTGVTAMARFTAKLMDRKGTTYPARDIASWFEHTDYVHISNEVSFVPDCEPSADRGQPFCSREQYIELMAKVHANLVELDGSHLDDFGSRWFAHTIEMYEQRGWHFFGGGRDQTEASRPLLLDDKAGTKLAFLGCNMPHSTSRTIRNRPDVAYCDLARLEDQIADLRHQGYTPIVSIQHEEVYTHAPPDIVVHDFRRLAAAGAAVVFGSQAHFAHPFEVVDGAFVHYGAGNLFFDQSWKGARDATNDRFYFHRGKLLAVDHLFTRIEEAGRPRPMRDDERAGLLKTLDEELEKLPHADPWRVPHEVARAA